MDSMLKVALMLTAIDKMSPVVSGAAGKTQQAVDKMTSGMQKMRDGFLLMGAGAQGFHMLDGAKDAFGDLEYAGNRLKASLMKEGGVLDEKVYGKMIEKSQRLSEKYANNSAAYLDMFRVLKNNGIQERDILGEIGEASEMLAVVLDAAPAQTAEFAAHMKRDMGIANKDMMGMMDLIARMHGVGVGKTGSETINEMNQFFSKEGLSAAIMESIGLEESKSVAAIGAMFMRRGLSGQTVGTNFRRMLDTMRNPKAMKEVSDEAAKFGIELELFDKKTHKFKGFDNMIAQFGKLEGFDVQTIDRITHAFGGRQGLSNDFIGLLSKEGVKDFNEMMKELYPNQAWIVDKANVLVEGQIYREKRLGAAWTNLKATFWTTLAPVYTKIIDGLSKCIQWMGRFTQQHPRIAKFIGVFIAVASSLIMLAGAFRILSGSFQIISMMLRIPAIIQAVGAAFSGLRLIMMTFSIQSAAAGFAAFAPWLLGIAIIVAIGLVFYGIYKVIIKHFGSLGNFFKVMWDKIKSMAKSCFEFIKAVIINTNPLFWIIANWGKITKFFSDFGTKTKNFFKSLGHDMFEAGKNIIKSIAEGMLRAFGLPEDAIKRVMTKVRSYLPFSPAKNGPLKDIHKIKLIETIAGSIKADSILAKMQTVGQSIMNYRLPQTASQKAAASSGMAAVGSGGGAIHIHYAPVYNAAPGEAPGKSEGFLEFARKNSRQLFDVMRAEFEKRERRKF